MVLRVLLTLALAGNALAFSANAPQTVPAVASSSIFEGLQSTPLTRASDFSSPDTDADAITLTSQWRQNTPLGILDETVVLAFLRHYGWFLCWEHAAQLRDVVLPATPSKKLYFVGIGSTQAAAEFASQLNIDPQLCFADEGGKIGDALGLEKGMGTMWNPPAVENMMGRNDEDSLKALGEAYKSAADNIGIQKLAPKKIQDTLRQGGTFVFKGDELLLEHYDSKVGDNCPVEDILKVL